MHQDFHQCLRGDRRWHIVLSLIGIAFISFGCTIKVPVSPDIGKLDIRQEIPLAAALLVTEETQNYVFKGYPESFTAGGRPHEFSLGEGLEKASVQAFSQVFQQLTVVRTLGEAKNYKLYIEPKIEDFHFRYDQLSYGGFAVAVLSKVKVRVTLASGETKVWEKSVESPEQKKGPWALNFSVEKEVGASASEAIAYTLREIAKEVAEDAAVREYIKGQV